MKPINLKAQLNKLKKIEIKHYVWVILIIGIGVLFRTWRLGSSGLNLDESQSVWQASHTLEFIRAYMVKNVHLPLHNSLLHLWITNFGTDEVTVRMLSVIPGSLSLIAIYFLARELFDKKIALLATTIATISPFWVWYSREIRMYTLLALVTTLSYLFFVRILKENRKRDFFFYTLINLIGIYTHYFFFIALITQGIFFLTNFKGLIIKGKAANFAYNRRVFVKLIAVAVVLFAAYAPWLYALSTSHGSGTFGPVLTAPTSFNIFLTMFEFSFGYQPQVYTSALFGFWPLVILFSFMFLDKRESKSFPVIHLLAFGSILPILAIFFVSVTIKPIYLTRYLMPTTPLYFILVAWFLANLKGHLGKFLTVIFLGIMIFSLYNQSTNPRNPFRENYKGLVQYINEEANPRDIVMLSPPFTTYPFWYYYEGAAKVTTMPVWDKKKGGIPEISPEQLESDSEFVANGHKRMFLVITTNLEGSAEVKEHFDNNYRKLEKRQFSEHIWVHTYQAEYL